MLLLPLRCHTTGACGMSFRPVIIQHYSPNGGEAIGEQIDLVLGIATGTTCFRWKLVEPWCVFNLHTYLTCQYRYHREVCNFSVNPASIRRQYFKFQDGPSQTLE
jgi:hypothetical protein